MANHNKITFAKEYCLCRKIPYKFDGETLIIGDTKTYEGSVSFFSVYNFSYADLIAAIDREVEYSEFGDYVRVKPQKRCAYEF